MFFGWLWWPVLLTIYHWSQCTLYLWFNFYHKIFASNYMNFFSWYIWLICDSFSYISNYCTVSWIPASPTIKGECEYHADQFPRIEQIIGGHLNYEMVPQKSYLVLVYNNGPRTYVPRMKELANPSTSHYSFASVAPAYRW